MIESRLGGLICLSEHAVSNTEQQELQWIASARRGDRNAFSKLVQAYQIPVFNLTYRMLGNAQEAEDAAQETFLRAYNRLSTYQPDKKFSNWILSIASHYCIDLLRRRRFQWLSVEDDPVMNWLSSDDEQPDEAALRTERAAEVRVLLERLEPSYRAPLVLRYWHDLSYREIADVLNLTEPAVKTRLHRARLQMAALLQEQTTAARPAPPMSGADSRPATRSLSALHGVAPAAALTG